VDKVVDNNNVYPFYEDNWRVFGVAIQSVTFSFILYFLHDAVEKVFLEP